MTNYKLALKHYGHLYERWNFEKDTGRCFYCDEAPETRDHIPALSWVDVLVNAKHNRRYRYWLVPSCSECNAELHDKALHTIFERACYIEKKLTAKYERKHMLWSKQELAKMSRTMQVAIKAKLAKNNILLDRIRAVQLRLLDADAFPEDV